MQRSKLRIISRESPLAMWQAEYVRDKLKQQYSSLVIEIIGIRTEADKFLNLSLDKMGGKGAFVKELEQALLNDAADIAVHSMKDVTIELPEQLALPVIMKREDVRDVMISNTRTGLEQMPAGSRIGTSSLRRRCQLKALRPDLEILDIRGNVGTRLKKLDDGKYDALILAAAGVKRLGMQDRITEFLEVDVLLPAIGQGALGVETRANNEDVFELISCLNDDTTHACVTAERALNRKLSGGCHAPVAAYAELLDENLNLRAMVGRLDGSELLRASVTGQVELAAVLGESLGQELLDRGAGDILRESDHEGVN